MDNINGDKLNKNLETFLSHIDSIQDALPMTLLLFSPYYKKATTDLIDFLKNEVQEIEDDDGKKKLLIKANQSKIYESLEKNVSVSALALDIIPESLFVSLISQYDAFLNRLLKAIFEIKPEILNSSERNLTFSQLVDMNSINDAREYIIEREIDTVLRKSHSEQFDYLESKLGMKLRENLPIWQTFIEITERRNLLVHCDGIVSNQYLKNCNEHSCGIKGVKVGDKLDIPVKYFVDAYKCLYEISVKLTHTIWRKLVLTDLESADRNLNDICFYLINNNSFQLADVLLSFGCNLPRHFNDSMKNVLIINNALSQYLQNNKEEAKKILSKKDWSASSDDFKLADKVLTDQYEDAYKIMIKIGENWDVDKSNYKEWPLFSTIRKEKKFKETYKLIYNEDYKVLETPMRPVQEIINKELGVNKELKKITTKKINSTKELKDKEKIISSNISPDVTLKV